MDDKFQLTSNNNYQPSKRANSAVKTAMGGKSGAPDHADSGSVKAPKGADQPKNQHTGGAVKSNTQKGDQSFTQPSGKF